MWTSEVIAGRDAEIFLPSRPVRFLLLFLTDWDDQSPRVHGFLDSHFQEYQFAVCVLKTSDCWWVDCPAPGFSENQTPENWLLNSWLPEWRARWGTQLFGIMGFGAGGQGALRLGFKYPRQFRAVASVEGCLDFHELHGRGTSLDEMYEMREHARQDTPVLCLRGYDVPQHIWLGCSPDSFWLRGNERLREKLAALGLPHTVDFNTSVCGHSWSFYETTAPRAVRYLAEGLKSESMKLA